MRPELTLQPAHDMLRSVLATLMFSTQLARFSEPRKLSTSVWPPAPKAPTNPLAPVAASEKTFGVPAAARLVARHGGQSQALTSAAVQ